mgnify:CR=1 FL=1
MNMSFLIPLLAIVYLAVVYGVILLAQRARDVESNRT